jgi:Cytochrome P460
MSPLRLAQGKMQCKPRRNAMQKYLLGIVGGVGVLAASSFLFNTGLVVTEPVVAQTQQYPVYDSAGRVNAPTGYRAWVFVGAPLTPEGLNDGKYNCDQPGGCTRTNFPEYHNVYIEKKNVDGYLQSASFPEGTVVVKELTRVLTPTFPDGSRTEPSGRGYFNGEYSGIDMTVKDSKRFAKTNGWGFFTFGHHPLPYDPTSAERPADECAGCHINYVANTDMTWIQFYPQLRGKKGY